MEVIRKDGKMLQKLSNIRRKATRVWRKLIRSIGQAYAKIFQEIIDTVMHIFANITQIFISLLTIALAILVFFYIVALAILAFGKLADVIGFYDIERLQFLAYDLTPIHQALRDLLQDKSSVFGTEVLSMILIIVTLLIAIIVISIFKDEKGLVILPFEVFPGEEKYNGLAISSLLTAELQRIRQIHEASYEGIELSEKPTISDVSPQTKSSPHSTSQLQKLQSRVISRIASEKLTFPTLTPASENLTYSVSELGTVEAGSISVPLGSLLIALRRFCPGGNPGFIINGSLQRYGSVINLVAYMDNKKACSWQVRHEAEPYRNARDEEIHCLIRDLAFKIAHDLSCKEDTSWGVSAKTWQGFKYFTEALNSYRRYNLTGNMKALECAHDNILKAANAEIDYEKPFDLIYNIGFAYINKKDYDNAEKLFYDAVAINPKIIALVSLGVVYAAESKKDKADDAYKRATRIKPQNKDDWLGQSLAFREMGRIDEAMNALEKAKDIEPGDASYCYEKGIALLGSKKPDEALVCLKKALDIDPKYVEAWNGSGNALLKLGRIDKALESYEKAIALDAKFVDIWNGKGNALLGLGRIDEGLKSYEKAIDLDPTFVNAWNGKGDALYYLGKYDEALESYEKAVDLDPMFVDAWNGKGNALWGFGRYEDALVCYDKAIDLDSSYAYAWLNKGNTLNELGRYDEALACYNMSLEIDPKNIETLNNKGFALSKLGRHEEALACYDKALVHDPKCVYAWYYKGNALKFMHQKDLSIKAYENAANFNPEDCMEWYIKGLALDNLNLTEDAIKAYKKAIDMNLKRTKAHIILARLYRKLGQETERSNACKTARDLIETEKEYIRACFEAICGSPDAALELLRTALEKKEAPPDWARQDPDFEFIRDDPRFSALLDEFSADGKEGPE